MGQLKSFQRKDESLPHSFHAIHFKRHPLIASVREESQNIIVICYQRETHASTHEAETFLFLTKLQQRFSPFGNDFLFCWSLLFLC